MWGSVKYWRRRAIPGHFSIAPDLCYENAQNLKGGI